MESRFIISKIEIVFGTFRWFVLQYEYYGPWNYQTMVDEVREAVRAHAGDVSPVLLRNLHYGCEPRLDGVFEALLICACADLGAPAVGVYRPVLRDDRPGAGYEIVWVNPTDPDFMAGDTLPTEVFAEG